MKYFKDEDSVVYAFEDDGSQDEIISPNMMRMTPEEVDSHLNPAPTYQQELAELNAVWQAKVEDYNKSFALASLSDGPSEETKKAAIREAYEVDKTQNASERASLKAKYGIGGAV